MLITSGQRGLVIALVIFGSAALHAQQPTPIPRAERPTSIERPSSSAIVAGTTSMDVLDSSYRLGIGDRLSYRVVEERREPVGVMVADNGEVEVPLIGRVSAKGRTCRELAQAIKPVLERDYFYKATVIVALDSASVRSRGMVYISGQVHAQGGVEIPPNEHFTLSKAILKAGGFADFANRKKVKVIRNVPGTGPQTKIYDLDAVTVRGELDKDPELFPDDTIIVPEKFVNL